MIEKRNTFVLHENFPDNCDLIADLGKFYVFRFLSFRVKATNLMARTISLLFLVVLKEYTWEWGSSAILYTMVYFLLIIFYP